MHNYYATVTAATKATARGARRQALLGSRRSKPPGSGVSHEKVPRFELSQIFCRSQSRLVEWNVSRPNDLHDSGFFAVGRPEGNVRHTYFCVHNNLTRSI